MPHPATQPIHKRMKARTFTQLLAGSFCLTAPVQAYISEPETTIYGRIVNRAGPVEQVMTEGTLTWKLRKPDGIELLLNGDVGSLNGGEYSYTLSIPHQALSLGQTPESTLVPLPPVGSTQQFTQITYNDQPALVMAPGSASFELLQARRGAAIRLDLEVYIPIVDGDHDGMADWWEDAHGLDKQNAADALLDPDGDGRNNLAEYLADMDPNQDSRTPKLRTTEVIAYSQSTSVVMLETADTDSPPQQLTYTLTSAPLSGALVLRNVHNRPAITDVVLSDGATFTQQDVALGRLLYVHDFGIEPASFGIRVADESPLHPPAEGTVRVLLFDPVTDAVAQNEAELLRLNAHAASSASPALVVADLSSLSGTHTLSAPSGSLTAALYASNYVPNFGVERSHYLIGGPGEDTLTGGMVSDVISGGGGPDRLSGKGGADLFLYASPSDGNDTILDYNHSEGDKIDIAALLTGTSSLLTDYVRITRSGADALLGIRFDGTATGYNDMIIRLANSPLTQSNLRSLYETGSLLTGRATLPPQVSILASIARGSENGPTPGQFTISRTKAISQPLTVALQITGSATNGTDYAQIGSSVVIPAGALSVNLTIQPYVDSLTELDEIVQISLLAQSAYELGTSTTAQVVIDDLKPQLTIEPLNALAEVSGQLPGAFLLQRTGVLDRSVLVRLTIGGNATNNIDYNRIDNYVNLPPNQTAAVIQITPKVTASLQKGAESVILTIKPDATYRIGAPGYAMVVIVPQATDLGTWKQTHFAGNNQSLDAFSQADPGSSGFSNLMRYGFGLNPANPTAGATQLLPRPEVRNGHLAIRFQKSPAAIDLDYQVELSNDMRDWHLGGTDLQDITPLEPGGDPTTAIYQMTDDMKQAKSKFMRVRLVRIQP